MDSRSQTLLLLAGMQTGWGIRKGTAGEQRSVEKKTASHVNFDFMGRTTKEKLAAKFTRR